MSESAEENTLDGVDVPDALDLPAGEAAVDIASINAQVAAKKGGWRSVVGWLRILVAIVLVGYVFSKIDWVRVADYRHQIDWLWLAGFVLILPAGNVVSSRKWQVLLQVRGHHVNFWRLFGLYNVGQFYNTVFPSTVGGDVARAVGLRKAINDTKIAFAATVAERVTGAIVLMLIGVTAMIISWRELWDPNLRVLTEALPIADGRVVMLLVLGAVTALLGALVAILDSRVIWLLRNTIGRIGPAAKIVQKLANFQEAMRAYRHHKRELISAFGYSFVFHSMTIFNIYAGCRMLGEPVSLPAVALATPIILLVALLPIAPGGYGIVQWGYMVTFVALGVISAEAPLAERVATAGTLGAFVSLLLSVRGVILNSIGYFAYTTIDMALERRERIRMSGCGAP